MKAFRVVLFASGLTALVLGSVSCASRSVAPLRTITGQFVVTDAATDKFRIIGRDGFYTAPTGTPMQALDGRYVQVQLTSSGRVVQVNKAPDVIEPIARGWGNVRGDLVVSDATTGRFKFAGDDHAYFAPSGTDLTLYAGRLVDIRLDESDRVTDMHVVSSVQPAYVPPSAAPSCSFRDQTYTAGAAICQSGTQYRCDDSQWRSLGIACQVSTARDLNEPTRALRDCNVGDATVVNGSGICRDGSTVRCADGAWIDTRTACR